MEFNVGDRVVVRDWDDMLEEFEFVKRPVLSYIGCEKGFTEEMRKMCGHTGTVRSAHLGRIKIRFDDDRIDSFSSRFSISSDMLRPEVETQDLPLCGDITELFGN